MAGVIKKDWRQQIEQTTRMEMEQLSLDFLEQLQTDKVSEVKQEAELPDMIQQGSLESQLKYVEGQYFRFRELRRQLREKLMIKNSGRKEVSGSEVKDSGTYKQKMFGLSQLWKTSDTVKNRSLANQDRFFFEEQYQSRKEEVTILKQSLDSQVLREIRYRFSCLTLTRMVEEKTKVVFLDEIIFPNQREEMFAQQEITNDRNLTLLALIDFKGRVHWLLRAASDSKYDDIEGYQTLLEEWRSSLNSESFEQETGQSKTVVILEGSIITNHEKVNQLHSTLDAQILLLPPYSPDLNPLQGWFSHLKNRITEGSSLTSDNIASHVQSLRQDKSINCRNLVDRAVHQMERWFHLMRL